MINILELIKSDHKTYHLYFQLRYAFDENEYKRLKKTEFEINIGGYKSQENFIK